MPAPRRVRRPMPLRGRRTSWPADSIGPEFSPNCLNIRFRFGEARNTPGRDILAGPATNQNILEITQFSLIDGVTIWPLMLSQNKLFRWGNAAPGTPTQWHQIPGNFVPAGTRRWNTAIGENHFFFCRGDDTIAQWDGVVGHNFDVITPTSGTVPKARFLEYFNNRLIAMATTEGGTTFANRVRWARSANFQAWDDTDGLGAGFLDITDENQEPIRGGRGLNGELAIYTRHSIKHMIPTGTLDPTHIVITRSRGIGCDAPYTIATAGQMQFFLGYDGRVWMWDGNSLDPVGTAIWEETRALVTPNQVDTYFGKVSISRGEYWLVIGTDVFIYDYLRSSWSRDSFPSLTALGEVEEPLSVIAWNQLVGSWDTQTLTWAQFAGNSITTLFGGRSDGATMMIDDTVTYDYFAIGSIIDRFLETEDMYLGSSDKLQDADPMSVGTILRMLLVYQFVNANPFEVGFSNDRGTTWQTQQVIPNGNGLSLIDFNTTGEIGRFRFRENDATGRFRWRSYEFEMIEGGDFIGSI